MGWKGFAIGMIAGGARGSWIGAIAGALIGDWLERRYFTRRRASSFSHASSDYIFEGDSLSSAYKILSVRPDAPYEVVHAAYRELAKKYHPDAMKAEGASQEEIAAAAEKMVKVNDAWKLIQALRKTGA